MVEDLPEFEEALMSEAADMGTMTELLEAAAQECTTAEQLMLDLIVETVETVEVVEVAFAAAATTAILSPTDGGRPGRHRQAHAIAAQDGEVAECAA